MCPAASSTAPVGLAPYDAFLRETWRARRACSAARGGCQRERRARELGVVDLELAAAVDARRS
jgi:hypothetical protein